MNKTPKFPFSPSVLDSLPEELAELFRGLEITLLEDICRRLRIKENINEVSVADIRALRSHGISLDSIKNAIIETTDIGAEKLELLLDDVVERNQKYYKEMITLADVTEPERLVNQEDIYAIYEQTKGTYKNITRSMGFLVRQGRYVDVLPSAKAYQWALDSAVMQVESGAISYNKAIAEAVKQLAESGLKVVEYDKDGKKIYRQVDVAVRACVMTGVNQLNMKYREQSMDYLETDLIELSAHYGARNKRGKNDPIWVAHSEVQGKIYKFKR